jgi:LmbE family N-acetylglucosaminyl deacetylase
MRTPLRLTTLLLWLCLPAVGSPPATDTLHLQRGERILIIAPHPDDEVLACGGLIQQALALGDSVWVVYVTAGDGSWPSAWKVTGNLFPGPEDYLELGRARIEEAKAGAQVLGLDTTRLVFLGYPDGELARLWQQDWYTPCRSSHTEAVTDPYGQSRHEYTGRSLLDDLVSRLRTLRPGRVFAPHPLDAHPDHWSTAMFMAIAREVWRQPTDGPFPMVYFYLVHHPSYPDARSDDAGFLSPPGDLAGTGHHWLTLCLMDSQVRAKQAALGRHDSQRGSAGKDLYVYAAENELFDRPEDVTGQATEDAPQIAFVPAARFSSVEAGVEGESLSLRVSLEAEPSPGLDYSLFVHSVELDADSVVHSGFTVELTSGQAAESQGWSLRMPRNRPSGSGALLYTAEVKWGSILLDHSGIGRIVY